MASLDAEWDEVGEFIPETAVGCKILWQCRISDHEARALWADYEPNANQRIEFAHFSQLPTVTLGEPPGTWTIDMEKMVQTNDKNGTKRSVRRTVVVAT